MSNTCEVCGTAMKPLLTSSYCPNECDKKPYLGITEILQNHSVKELQEAIDKSISWICWIDEPLIVVNPSSISSIASMIWPWPDIEE